MDVDGGAEGETLGTSIFVNGLGIEVVQTLYVLKPMLLYTHH